MTKSHAMLIEKIKIRRNDLQNWDELELSMGQLADIGRQCKEKSQLILELTSRYCMLVTLSG